MDYEPTTSADDGLVTDVRWLRTLAVSVIGDASLADDACQEAWLAVRRSGGDIGDERRPALFRAMRRFAWRSRRADVRRAARETVCHKEDSLPSTEELLSRGEQRRLLWRRLTDLDEPYRTTLLLRFQEGLDTKAIAARSQSPEDTVRRRVRRGLELLRERYRRDGESGSKGFASLAIAALPLGSPSTATTSAASGAAIAALPAVAILGAWMMKKWLFVALLLMAALVVGLALGDPEGIPAPSDGGDQHADSAAGSIVAQQDLLAKEIAPVTRSAVDLADASSAADSNPIAACRVLGKVVDAAGEPLSGARIVLVCRVSKWASDHIWATDTFSSLDGSFELQSGGLQSQENVRLEVTASPFHRRVVRSFGREPGHDFGPLSVAEVDVGVLQIHPAGAVDGRVVDTRGAPISGVRVDDDRSGESKNTGRGGRFRLDHVAAGAGELSFMLAGFLEHEERLEWTPGVLLDIGDIVLLDAPRVTGSVTDLQGNPLAEAKVSTRGFTRGWSFETGSSAGFDVPLPVDGPGRVIARAPGHVQSKGARVTPGQQGVQIRLAPRDPRGVFVVVNRETGEEVTRFGVRILKGAGAKAGDVKLEPAYGLPRIREFARARVTAPCRIGVDQVEVIAPGCARLVLDVDDAAFSAEGQRLALRTVPGLRGRIVDASGVGIASQLVTLMFGEVGRVTIAGSDEQVPFDPQSELARLLKQQGGYAMFPLVALHEPLPPFVLSTYMGLKGYKAHTDAKGRFQFDVGTGVGRLLASGTKGRCIPSTTVSCVDGDCDVGDVLMGKPARLRGRFVPSMSVDMSGSVVTIKSVSEIHATVAADGAFEFLALPPGDHWFSVDVGESIRSSKPWDHSWFVRLEAGEDYEVEVPIDMEPACRLTASLRVNGKPARGSVTFVPDGGTGAVGEVDFGVDGVGVGTVKAGVHVRALVSIGWDTVHRSEAFVLPSGTSDRMFELSVSSLEVVLPSSFELPGKGTFRLSWRTRNGQPGTGLTVSVGDRKRVLGAKASNDLRVLFPNVPSGATVCVLEFRPGEFYSGNAWQRLGSFDEQLVKGADLRVTLR